MIEYKELEAIPYKPTIKPPKNAKTTDAYTAELYTTKKGRETLVITLYSYNKLSNEYELEERHYISETGEFASSRFDAVYRKFKRGNFRVGNSDWDLREWYYTGSLYCYRSIRNADKIIFDFIERHKALNEYPAALTRRSGIEWAANYQECLLDDKKKAADKKRTDRTMAEMSVVKEHPKELEEWAFGELLNTAAFFYSYKSGQQKQKGICSACNKVSELENIRSKGTTVCPHCGKTLCNFNTNAKRFRVANCLTFETSSRIRYIEMLSENRYVTRSFCAISEYRYHTSSGKCTRITSFEEMQRDMWHVEPYVCAKKDAVYNGLSGGRWEKVLVRSRWHSVCEDFRGVIYPCNILDITKSIKLFNVPNMDIRLLCTIEEPVTRIYNSLSKLPVIESLGKLGMHNLAKQYINSPNVGYLTSNSPMELLGIDRNVLRLFSEIDPFENEIEMWKKQGLNIKDADLFKRLVRTCRGHYHKVAEIRKKIGCSLLKTVNYIEKQCKKFSVANVLMYWGDYLEMAEQAGVDLKKNPGAYFPKDIKKEHDRCSDVIEIARNEEVNRMLSKRAVVLDKLSYSDKEYMIFPLRTTAEFIKESKKLNHCVKTYADRCAEGKTNIFALRLISAPDKPYFTVNINNSGGLMQNRGKNNCAPPSEVSSFVTKWLKYVSKQIKIYPLEKESPENQNKIRIGA